MGRRVTVGAGAIFPGEDPSKFLLYEREIALHLGTELSKALGATLAHCVRAQEQYPVDLGPWAHTGWGGVGVHRLLRTHVGSRCLTSTCWQERLPPQKLELPSPGAVLPGDAGWW